MLCRSILALSALCFLLRVSNCCICYGLIVLFVISLLYSYQYIYIYSILFIHLFIYIYSNEMELLLFVQLFKLTFISFILGIQQMSLLIT